MNTWKPRWGMSFGISFLIHCVVLLLAGCLIGFFSSPNVKNVVEVDLVDIGGGGGGGGHPGPEGPAVSAPKAENAAPPAEEEIPDAEPIPDTAQMIRPDVKPSEKTASSHTAKTQGAESSSESTETGGGGGTGNGIGTGDGSGIGPGSGGGSGGGNGGGIGPGDGPGLGPGSGELVLPQKLYCPEPPYPKSAYNSSTKGKVTVGLTITAEGTVSSVWIDSSSGNDALDQSALDTVHTWLFAPAKRGGIPIEVKTAVTITFNIKIVDRKD